MKHATSRDIPAVLAMMRRFHEREALPYDFDAGAAEDTLQNLVDGTGCLLVTPGGFMAGVLFTAPTNSDWLIAAELFWYAEDGSGARLMAWFRKWAVEAGVQEIRLSCPAHNVRVQNFYAQRGTLCETVYSEVI